MTLSTYLSDYVYQIIVEHNRKPNNCTSTFVNKDLTFNWTEIEGVLGEITDEFDILNQSEEWFLEKCQLVWSIIHKVGSALSHASLEERNILKQLCSWVNFPPEYDLQGQNDEADILLAILVVTAVLERALGNVYMKKKLPVPFLLRDLLKTLELTVIFGRIPVVFTQLLVGCPRGFNLRNVAWHGFFSPGELHPDLLSGLIVLIASLGKFLQDQVIPKRPQYSLFTNFEELDSLFPEINSRHSEVHDLINNSPLIPEKSKILWRKAYKLFLDERFGYSLVLIMPQLEHCLRILYCRVNDCPSRLLTAESTVFYTTLDEILAPSKNAVVGDGLLMILLDVTASLTGPRLRDRLSHGEIRLDSVPRWLVNFIFCVALATAHSDHHEVQIDRGKHCGVDLCTQLEQVTSHYHSKFHIVVTLQRQLVSLLDQWPSFQHHLQPKDVVLQHVSCQLIQALDQMLFPYEDEVLGKISRVRKTLEENKPLTLYRPKPELELAAALSAVVSRITQTAEKASHAVKSRYQLWCDRGLRSRSRATAVRMWSVLPDVWRVLLCMVMVVAFIYRQLPSVAARGKPVFRLVKTLTKAVENTVSLCDVDKNRWTEAHQVLSDAAATCLQFFTKNSDLVNM